MSSNPDKITYLGVTDTRILMEKIKKQNAVIQAARDLLSAIYVMRSPEEIKEFSCYSEIEDLELALTGLDD